MSPCRTLGKLSRLDYCNGLLSSLPSTYPLKRLQRLQNWAARLVFEGGRKNHLQSTFEITTLASNTTKDQFQIAFVCTLEYKCLHN